MRQVVDHARRPAEVGEREAAGGKGHDDGQQDSNPAATRLATQPWSDHNPSRNHKRSCNVVANPLAAGREARDQGAEEVKPRKGIDDTKNVANEHRSPAGGSPGQVGDLDPDERFTERVAEEAFE